VKCIKSEYKQDQDERSLFVEDLPYTLKQDLCVFLYGDIYKKVIFLKDKNISFTSWVCPLLKPNLVTSGEYVFNEADDIKFLFFNPSSFLSYVLPKYMKQEYIRINMGNEFGLIDLVYAMYKRK